MITTTIHERLATLSPVRAATPSEVVAPEEAYPIQSVHAFNNVEGVNALLPPQTGDVPPQWLARLECLQKGLKNVHTQVMGAPSKEKQGIPFTKGVMADELLINCRTPAIIEYNGTIDPQEHLSHFENAPLLDKYTDGIKCRVFVINFAGEAQQWFNQLPSAAIGNFQEFRSLFCISFPVIRDTERLN
ncbi:hypothetical protein Sango_1741100 [Sesamum angolense]|uniref:Retrotransposon gag protein n=1 Tax=Sesamum angolense TaxID=2727404 RepID=A0AAE2BSE5_9LAMI|nr:hypothetical protein Sango_1741100 [Sesamum angolense]